MLFPLEKFSEVEFVEVINWKKFLNISFEKLYSLKKMIFQLYREIRTSNSWPNWKMWLPAEKSEVVCGEVITVAVA